MKKLFILFFLIVTMPAFSQISNISTEELMDYNMDLGIRKITKKIPVVPIPGQFTPHKFFGNLTTDTLIAAIARYIRKNFIITPDNKVIVKPPPGNHIELFKEFVSEPEVATIYTWKGKIIYTQKFLISWASPSIEILSGIETVYFWKFTDVSTKPNSEQYKWVPMIAPIIEFNQANGKVVAFRPGITAGYTNQRAEIIIQYTKQ